VLCGSILTLIGLKSTPPHLDTPFGLYPVSILKPLKGIENGIRDNIKTFFELDYPNYELLFSVADAADPARAVVEELMKHYPHVRARFLIGEIEAGPNPKVNNMIRSYEAAAHDLILISDSNVRVTPAYLKRLMAHLDPSVGIITAVVAARGAESLGGRLEAMYLHTFYTRWMYLAAAFGQPCVVGKSMLLNRKAAARFGGIRALARYLAEDYMAGVAMRRIGMRVVIMADPVPQHVGKYSVKEFWSRHIRWGRMRKVQAPLAFLGEPLMGPILSSWMAAWSASLLFGLDPVVVVMSHLGLWSFCDLLLAKRIERAIRPDAAFTWFLRELLALPMWIHTAVGNQVQWRGKTLTLRPGGLVEAMPSSPTRGNAIARLRSFARGDRRMPALWEAGIAGQGRRHGSGPLHEPNRQGPL